MIYNLYRGTKEVLHQRFFSSRESCMYHIICIMNVPCASQHGLFNYIYMQNATHCMWKCVHPNTG